MSKSATTTQENRRFDLVSGASHNATDPARIRRELVFEFARRQGIGATVTIAVTLMMAVLLWGLLPMGLLIVWAVAQSVLALASWHRWSVFADRAHLETSRVPGAVEAAAWKFASGLLWGVTAFVAHELLGPPHDLFLYLIIAGMAAGATSTLGALREAGYAFTIGTLAPTAVAFALAGTELDIALAVLALVFMVAMIGTVRRTHLAVASTIVEHLANEQMRAQFEVERDEWLSLSSVAEAFAVFDADDRLLAWNERHARRLESLAS